MRRNPSNKNTPCVSSCVAAVGAGWGGLCCRWCPSRIRPAHTHPHTHTHKRTNELLFCSLLTHCCTTVTDTGFCPVSPPTLYLCPSPESFSSSSFSCCCSETVRWWYASYFSSPSYSSKPFSYL